jgi:hypothetical protein
MYYGHRWACLLRQQSSITVYCLPTKENKRPFSVSVCSKQTKVFFFRLQKTNGSCHFQLVPLRNYQNVDVETWTRRQQTENGKRKPKFFLTPIVFAHRANGNLSFVRLLTEKQTEVNRLLTE